MREYLAKPSGITLKQHTDNVVEQANVIIKAFPFIFSKYIQLFNIDLKKRLLVSCKYHDLGKSNKKWQDACWADHLNYLKWKRVKGGSYQEFEKERKDISGKNLRSAGVRHEIFSLVLAADRLPPSIQVAIAAHHRKLSIRFENRWRKDFSGINGEKANKLFDYFYNLSIDSFPDAILKVYEFSAVRSLLILADHRASRKEAGGKLPKFKKFTYNFPEKWKPNRVQEIAIENWKDDLLLLRAPTGAGKTDASLLWAKKQVEDNRASRLIIAMPTRFTSNALTIEATDKLSQTGLYHSTAQFSELYQKSDSEKDLHEFSRQLLTPCTVCTIDHLLIAMTLMREDHHAILFNLANSCVVIDEADFYDGFTQVNIQVLLQALKKWRVPVMIMSASLPEASLEMYKEVGYNIKEIKEDTSDCDRKRCEIKSITPYEKVEELEELLTKCIQKECAIIYANTVAKAMEFHDWFYKKNVKPILYHSRFTEPHKKLKEEELINALGKDAWKSNTAKGIAILTQIGEMSVNISADLMISDICPIDRLVQRAGRLCRFDKDKIGELYVLSPQKGGNSYPAPYGTYLKGKNIWVPEKVYKETKKRLHCKAYSSAEFVNLINKVYPKLENFEFKAIRNANQLKQHFLFNWVLNTKTKMKEDEEQTDFWKSRDIDNNVSLFVTRPEKFYQNYFDFQKFKIENSISVHPYLVDRGRKKYGTVGICTIKIRNDDNTEQIHYLINEDDCYSIEQGLMIDKEIDQFL